MTVFTFSFAIAFLNCRAHPIKCALLWRARGTDGTASGGDTRECIIANNNWQHVAEMPMQMRRFHAPRSAVKCASHIMCNVWEGVCVCVVRVCDTRTVASIFCGRVRCACVRACVSVRPRNQVRWTRSGITASSRIEYLECVLSLGSLVITCGCVFFLFYSKIAFGSKIAILWILKNLFRVISAISVLGCKQMSFV